MNWEAIGAVGELIGAAGVIGSLLFLAFETRKNTNTARASLTNDSLTQIALLNDLAVGDPKLRDLIDKSMTPEVQESEFSHEEWKALVHFARGVFWRIEGMHTLYRQGLIEKELWSTRLSMCAGVIQFPIWHKYWEIDKANSIYTPSFVEAVEKVPASDYRAPEFGVSK